MDELIVHFRVEPTEDGKELLVDFEGGDPPKLGEIGFDELMHAVAQSIDGGLTKGEFVLREDYEIPFSELVEFRPSGTNYAVDTCECCIKKEASMKQKESQQ